MFQWIKKAYNRYLDRQAESMCNSDFQIVEGFTRTFPAFQVKLVEAQQAINAYQSSSKSPEDLEGMFSKLYPLLIQSNQGLLDYLEKRSVDPFQFQLLQDMIRFDMYQHMLCMMNPSRPPHVWNTGDTNEPC